MNANQVKINYPKLKTKTKEQLDFEKENNKKQSKFCPQMCKIEYPTLNNIEEKPKDLGKLHIKPKNKIDLVLS